MLKIVYPICCGIDVHKKFIVACIASTNSVGVTTYQSKRFSTFTNGLRELSKWLCKNSCKDVCMESTGKYWIPVFNTLEADNFKVTLAHPKYLKAIRGKKTDKKDAKWIADLFKHDLVTGSFMPPHDIRQLRDLMRYRFKLINMRSGEKKRLQDSLTVSNIQLASVVSDTFGKSSMAILERLLENPSDTSFDIVPLVHKSMLAKVPDLQLAIDGAIVTQQVQKLNIILGHYNSINTCIKNLENTILELVIPYRSVLDIIMSTPGIGEFSAITILSEIGSDMSVFISDKHLCSWAGLVPASNESGGKKKSVRISKAGAYIKPTLVQCANAVVMSNKHPEIKNRFLNIKKRRGHKRAIIAVARMLLTAIYHMISNGQLYDSTHYSKLHSIPKSRELSLNQALKLLKNHGYSISEPIPA
jgi:transposase